MQIIVEPPSGVTVWWYTPRDTVSQWYLQAMRPRLRNGEVDGVEYCILATLRGRKLVRLVRYMVTPYCDVSSTYNRTFSSRQRLEAMRYTRYVAAIAYRRAVSPLGKLWWHQWSPHLNDKLEPFYAH